MPERIKYASLFIHEEYVNATEGYRFGDSGDEPYEAYTDNIGDLFRSLQRENGRCTGKVYVDTVDGKPITVGWVFQKRMQYEDSQDTYLREVWVTLHDGIRPARQPAPYHAL